MTPRSNSFLRLPVKERDGVDEPERDPEDECDVGCDVERDASGRQRHFCVDFAATFWSRNVEKLRFNEMRWL